MGLTQVDRQYSARVGMIGAGQLARMSQQAAIALGVELQVLAAHEHDPAVLAGATHRIGEPFDAEAIIRLAGEVDVVTLDHELVSNEALRAVVESGVPVRPAPESLRFAQDKLFARQTLFDGGFPVPAFRHVDSQGDVAALAETTGWPVVLKAETMGYDGRGVVIASDAAEAESVTGEGDWLVEEHLDLAVELSVLIARRPGGQSRTYPVIETVQVDGICHELVMPARINDDLRDRAISLAEDVVVAIGASGIVAVEMFYTTDGRLLVNELATRPHNSGHATIEGAVTSQFENHIRAVLDWPLGDTRLVAPAAAMVNVLGTASPGTAIGSLPEALTVDGARIHLYGKHERTGRKIGHVTALGETAEQALDVARRAARQLGGTI